MQCDLSRPKHTGSGARNCRPDDGTYILDAADSDNINEAIETAVGKLDFVRRDMAGGRLEKLNPAYHKVAITSSPERNQCHRG